MRGTTTRLLCLTLAALAVAQFSGLALAQSPLGIGSTETAMPTTGLFGGLLAWINVQQQGFYRTLTGALRTMRDEGTGAWMLVAVSFAYGVFHAAGPGHGKAVISLLHARQRSGAAARRALVLFIRHAAGRDRHRGDDGRLPVPARHRLLDGRCHAVPGDRELCAGDGVRCMASVAQGIPAPEDSRLGCTRAQPVGLRRAPPAKTTATTAATTIIIIISFIIMMRARSARPAAIATRLTQD